MNVVHAKEDGIRLAILGLLVAIFSEAKGTVPTYKFLGFKEGLNVLANSFFNFSVVLLILYLLCRGMEYCFEHRFQKFWKESAELMYGLGLGGTLGSAWFIFILFVTLHILKILPESSIFYKPVAIGGFLMALMGLFSLMMLVFLKESDKIFKHLPFYSDMDSLRKVVRIMQYLEDNLEKDGEAELKNRFKDDYVLFSRYCLGDSEPYAVDKGKYISLTQVGVRKLYELRRTLAEEKMGKWVAVATVMIAIFTIAQVLLAVI